MWLCMSHCENGRGKKLSPVWPRQKEGSFVDANARMWKECHLRMWMWMPDWMWSVHRECGCEVFLCAVFLFSLIIYISNYGAVAKWFRRIKGSSMQCPRSCICHLQKLFRISLITVTLVLPQSRWPLMRRLEVGVWKLAIYWQQLDLGLALLGVLPLLSGDNVLDTDLLVTNYFYT